MKKVLLLLLAMLSITFAEVKVTQYVEVGFEGLIAHYVGNSLDCAPFLDLESEYTEYPDIYYSSLDSNVFFSTNEGYAADVQGDFKLTFWVLSSSTHSLGEVIRDQFRLFKECETFVERRTDYVIDPTDRLDGIADTAATLIDSALKNSRSKYLLYENNCSWNIEGGPCTHYGAYYGAYYDVLPEIQAIIDAQNGKTALNTRERYRVDFNLSDGRLDVPEQMIGRRFQMYDASGRRHVDDRLQNTLDLPSAPRYIKIKMR